MARKITSAARETMSVVREMSVPQELRFLPVEPVGLAADDEQETTRRRLLIMTPEDPTPPRPLGDVLVAVDKLKEHPWFGVAARSFDLYYDWLVPYRRAGRITQ